MNRVTRTNIQRWEWALVCGIMLLAIVVRVYRVEEFAIFLSDQAIDSQAVRSIIEGHLTLLGPRASVGDFFNGPIVYYLMVPFSWILRNDPLGGTFFQITLQIATIPVIYSLIRKWGGTKGGVIGAIIIACSPLYIQYSRGAFNAYPALFFTTCVSYVLMSQRTLARRALVAGALTGMMVQMHYLLYVYALMYGLFIVWRERDAKVFAMFVIGCLIGLAPFLAFELRHDLLNIRAILTKSHMLTMSYTIMERVSSVGTSVSAIVGVSRSMSGVFLALATLGITAVRNKAPDTLRTWFLLHVGALAICFIMYPGILLDHYIIGFHVAWIVALSLTLSTLLSARAIFATVILYTAYSLIVRNDVFRVPPAQDGVSLQDQRAIVRSIKLDRERSGSQLPWNLTQDAQQDNRAMPIRYLLSLDPPLVAPLGFEDYTSNRELYVLRRKTKQIASIDTWEVRSFGTRYEVLSTYPINEEYVLSYLRKM